MEKRGNMDKCNRQKQGYELPNMKRRYPCRVPSLNMHNKQQAYIERLILENQELRDRVADLEQKVSVFAYEATPKLRERVKKLEKEVSSNEEGIVVSPTSDYVDQRLTPIEKELERLKGIHHTH